MSITTFGNSIPGYFLGRPRSVYLDRFGKRAEVLELRNRTATEAMRMRAVA